MKPRIKAYPILFTILAALLAFPAFAVAQNTDAGCLSCHDDFDKTLFAKSAHADLSCENCHSGLTDPTPHANGEYEPKAVSCNSCHEEEAFSRFGHDAANKGGNRDAPSCIRCHGAHDVRQIEAIDSNAFTLSCIRCHGDKEMMTRNKLTTTAVNSYENTYHGQVRNLGYTTHVAGCPDCHSGHNILPADNPDSILHPNNLVAQCGKCHENSNANFVKFVCHPEYLNRTKNPILFWTVIIMTAVLSANLLFFLLHTGLWWRKSYAESLRNRKDKEEEICCDPELCVTRFSLLDRLMHLALAASFFGLVLTGIPLLFHRAPWAQVLMIGLGGAETAGLIHRIMAGVQIALFGLAIILILRFFLFKKKKDFHYAHPDSLIFHKQDWHDLKAMFRWFVSRGEKPKFDRWTYWEKADIFAFFWGMFTIGLSGLILWFPETFAALLPGWIFNVAIIIHSFEAMLATVVIFTAHFFNTHLLPEKFPMDMVMFTGRLKHHDFVHERSLQYERLEKEGKLEQSKSPPLSRPRKLLYGMFGIVSLVLGWILMAMIVIGLIYM